jgi:hypothetical protein
LSASITVSAATSAQTLELSKFLQVSASATVTASPIATLYNGASASATVSGSASATLSLTKQLESSLDVSANVIGDAKLDNSAQTNALVEVVAELGLAALNPLEAIVYATNVTSTVLNVDKLLASDLNVSASTSGDIFVIYPVSENLTTTVTVNDAYLFVSNNASTSINVSGSVSGSAVVDKDLFANIDFATEVNAELALTKNLSGNLSVDTDMIVGIPLYCEIQLSVNAYPLLNVNSNVTGSPGGPSVDGFTPLSALRLLRVSESADPSTHNVTASFSEDPDVVTEIMEVDLDDNPAGVISYSYTGNQVTFDVLTPREVYAESSTFVLSKEVSPLYNTIIDYNTKFSAKIKQSRIGNNFYSSKFYVPGDYLCSLKDDGYGNINLYEWIDPVTPEYVRTVGTVDYDTGAVSIRQLNITAIQDPRMFFWVESLDALAPTKDYIDLKSSQLVQSSTLTFPSGETVEISSYEKQTDLVVLWAYIKARSYNVATPEVTLETREVTYKIIILPDYDLSKQKILQSLAAATN